MANKKNLVIKLKYPATVKKNMQSSSASAIVAQWDMKRVMVAVVILVLVAVLSVAVLNQGKAKSIVDENVSDSAAQPPAFSGQDKISMTHEGTGAVSSPSPTSRKNATVATANPQNEAKMPVPLSTSVQAVTGQETATAYVSRALLTYKIKKNKPMTEIPRIVTVRKYRPAVINYFTELQGMAGHDIYHEWLLDGKVITRYTLDVHGDNWSTSSRMLVSVQTQGHWKVRLLDENNRILNQQNFTVAYHL